MRVILFTAPPIEETVIQESLTEIGSKIEIRKAKDAAEYASVVRDVGTETGIPVLDVWKTFMAKAGWKVGDHDLPGSKELRKSKVLADLLYDGEKELQINPKLRLNTKGLHLSADGYRVVFEGLMELIIETWPDQNPNKMPYGVKVPWEEAFGSTFWDVSQD